MTAARRLARYRTRHVISPRVRFGDPDNTYCAHDDLRIIRRRGGWRHDPDEVKHLVRVVPVSLPHR